MKLNELGLADRTGWEKAGYSLPEYDRKAVAERTKQNPFWIHFGAGNIFRAFHASAVQRLLDNGVIDRGIIAAEGYDEEIVDKICTPHDDYTVAVTLKSNGTLEKAVVGSIAETLPLSGESFEQLKRMFTSDSLQMATFTITEKGYNITDEAKTDFERGSDRAESYIGRVTALVYARFLAGEKPISMVSMDNCSHNGDKLRDAVKMFAHEWQSRGFCRDGFEEYVSNPEKVAFPWTMIDKITPRPDSSVEEVLKADGVEGCEPVITGKNTYIAPFVNAEECEYLVIEDSFPNGRPPLHKCGFIFTDRETVEKVERMKVCTCLNPLHTALAVFGCLLGYTKISDEMNDPVLKKLVEGIGYREGLPVVENPGIIDPREFMDTVVNVRIPNPFLPDTPQRIATDTSQKLSVRFGETVKAYQNTDGLDTSDLKLIPLVFAGWLRYLIGIDDRGHKMELSPDPMLNRVIPIIEQIGAGAEEDEKILRPILENERIFGVNLYKAGLAKRVCELFEMMIKAPGAVRKTLENNL